MKKRSFIGLLCLLIMQTTYAQDVTNRYMLMFADKAPCENQLQNPSSFLSERALERRINQGISVTLEDVPPCTEYISQVREQVSRVLFTSRWFNGVLVEADEKAINSISSLPFVQQIILAAPDGLPQTRKGKGKYEPKRLYLTKDYEAPLQFQFLGIPELQEAGFSGSDKLLAVFDAGFTGVDRLEVFDHVFRNQQLIVTKNFVAKTDSVFYRSTHGTKALSTIVAVDSGNYIGTAPNASLALAITEDINSEYWVEEYNWLFAAEWADSLGADAISSSLGYSTFDDPAMNYSYENLDGLTTISARAVQEASERGMLVVVSAGNSGASSWRYLVTPADAPDAIAVGATDSEGNRAYFSSFGPSADGRTKPDVAALGQGTLVANSSGGFGPSNGTSFAAPQIAGLALSLWQAYPQLTAKELAEFIRQSGTQAETPDNELGYGTPSYVRFFQLVSSAADETLSGLKVYPNPISSNQVILESPAGLNIKGLSLFDASGRKLQLLVSKSSPAEKTAAQLHTLTFTELKAGLYILEVKLPKRNERLRLLKF